MAIENVCPLINEESTKPARVYLGPGYLRCSSCDGQANYRFRGQSARCDYYEIALKKKIDSSARRARFE